MIDLTLNKLCDPYSPLKEKVNTLVNPQCYLATSLSEVYHESKKIKRALYYPLQKEHAKDIALINVFDVSIKLHEDEEFNPIIKINKKTGKKSYVTEIEKEGEGLILEWPDRPHSYISYPEAKLLYGLSDIERINSIIFAYVIPKQYLYIAGISKNPIRRTQSQEENGIEGILDSLARPVRL